MRWEVVDGPQEWIGTTVEFELTQEDEFTIVLFRHEGWREPVEFMSPLQHQVGDLPDEPQAAVETGKGEPAPHDVQISNWH